MGAWGELAFDNDSALDWASDLEDVDDLSLIETAIDEFEEDSADSYLAETALAACDVLARLLGKSGYSNAYTEDVDKWVASHPLVPSRELLRRAIATIDRILDHPSELWEFFEDDSAKKWRHAVQDLRRRLQ